MLTASHWCKSFLVSGEETKYGGPIYRSVGPSVIDFLIFHKIGSEIIISDLSNTTKLTLLESLLQEVTAIVQLPNPKFSTVV